MTMIELCISGALDAFGTPFRNWAVRGWEAGRVPPDYVCELYCDWEPSPEKAIASTPPQLELFA